MASGNGLIANELHLACCPPPDTTRWARQLWSVSWRTARCDDATRLKVTRTCELRERRRSWMIGVCKEAVDWERRRFISAASELPWKSSCSVHARGRKKKYLAALAYWSKLELVIKKVILLYLIQPPPPHPQGFSNSKAGWDPKVTSSPLDKTSNPQPTVRSVNILFLPFY